MEDVKVYKTPDQLIEIMLAKGLTIKDKKKAKKILTEVNYFILTYYSEILKDKNGRFIKGATFEELHQIYIFDKDIKMLFLRILLDIENQFKTALNELISTRYGYRETAYLRDENYDKHNPHVKRCIHNIESQIEQYGKKNEAVAYYKDKYGYIPFWVLTKILTLGNIKNLFDILRPKDKLQVTKHIYDLELPTNPVETLQEMLYIFVDLRNKCAHDEFVFDYQHSHAMLPPLKEHKSIENPNIGHNDLLAFIISLKYVCQYEVYTNFLESFNKLLDNLDKASTLFDKDDYMRILSLK